MGLVLLVGISGVGKTTIGEAVAQTSPITYIYATTEKLRFLRADETLNLLDQARTYEVNEKFFNRIRTRQDDVLVDTHAAYPVGAGFVTLTPPSACSLIGGIVFVEADPGTVQARRVMRGRTHEPTDLPTITREAAEERAEVERLREVYGIPVCTVDSSRTPVDRAVSIVKGFVDGAHPVAAEPTVRSAGTSERGLSS